MKDLRQVTRRAARRALGRCCECSRPCESVRGDDPGTFDLTIVPARVRCPEHARQNRLRQQAKHLVHGLCHDCGRPAGPAKRQLIDRRCQACGIRVPSRQTLGLTAYDLRPGEEPPCGICGAEATAQPVERAHAWRCPPCAERARVRARRYRR